MSKVAYSRKRKVNNRTINEKYKILKEVDERFLKRSFAIL